MAQAESFPKRFGPFVLLRELGVGGMGAAYLAMHTETGSLLVVKRMHAEFQREEVIFKRFVHEAEVATHVRHPNVAALVAMGTIDQEPFLATEYVFGIQISHIVDRIETSQIDPVPLPIGLSLAVDLASGIEAIHGARHQATGEPLGLIHRDIGSRNVLVGFDGGIRIIDLGLGKSVLADWQTASQVLAGSPDYMPPEQAMGARVDGRADIYSASVTCWELLAGKKRIREEGVAARLARAIQAQPESLIALRPDASKKLDALIQHAMNPDPELRTPTALIFRKALQEELSHLGKKRSKEDVAIWLDSACATVIAREKRLLEEAREKALAMVAPKDNARTELLVGGQDAPAVKDNSPYNFYTGVAFVAERPPAEPIEHDTLPSQVAYQERQSSGGIRVYVERLGASSTFAALGAIVDPTHFEAQPRRVRAVLIGLAAIILLAIAVGTAILVRPRPPAIQVSAIPETETEIEADAPPRRARVETPKSRAETLIEPGQAEADDSERDDGEEDEVRPSGGKQKVEPKTTDAEPKSVGRALAPEVESRKNDLVRRIRQLRRVRFDVNFQRKVTELSTRLSKARSMKALDDVESAMARLEKET